MLPVFGVTQLYSTGCRKCHSSNSNLQHSPSGACISMGNDYFSCSRISFCCKLTSLIVVVRSDAAWPVTLGMSKQPNVLSWMPPLTQLPTPTWRIHLWTLHVCLESFGLFREVPQARQLRHGGKTVHTKNHFRRCCKINAYLLIQYSP